VQLSPEVRTFVRVDPPESTATYLLTPLAIASVLSRMGINATRLMLHRIYFYQRQDIPMDPSIVQHAATSFVDTFSRVPGMQLARLGHALPVQFAGPYEPSSLNAIYVVQRVQIIVVDLTAISAAPPPGSAPSMDVTTKLSRNISSSSLSPFT